MISRRTFSRIGATALAAPRIAASAPPNRPNVIIVLADDQGYGDFSSHGNKELPTPQLDKFRSESVRFTDFHAAPMCTPTRAQLMTGRDALFTRAMNVSSGRALLRTDLPTLAEVLAKQGYGTGLFGKWHLGDNYPYRPEDRGFQETVWFPSSHIGSVPDAWNNDYFNDRYRNHGRLRKYTGYCTDVFFDEATQWMLGRHKARQPFFAYIALNAAHTPLFVPQEYAERFKHLPDNVARFYGMIANIDDNAGRLEKTLRDSGLLENTIVIYTTDNGGTQRTMRHNAGLRGHKTTLYEGGHRVPFFVRWPNGNIGGGRDVAELAHMQDVFPTLLDLCGVEMPARAKFDGVSLAPLMQGREKSLPDRNLVVQFSRMNVGRPRKDDAAVMWRNWRLVHGRELYDVAADPGQTENRIASQPAIAARLQKHYDAWWQRVEPLLDGFLPLHVGSKQENPTLVSACEWADVFLDLSMQVRAGERKNSVWHILVEQEGEYEIGLRRWPRGAQAAIVDGVPPHVSEDGGYPAGVAIPIRKARLRIGSFDQTIDVAPKDAEAVFRMRLSAGRTTMQSWFIDGEGQPLLGAYYAYVERKTGRQSVARPISTRPAR